MFRISRAPEPPTLGSRGGWSAGNSCACRASNPRRDRDHEKNSGGDGALGGMRKLNFRTQLQFDFNLDEHVDRQVESRSNLKTTCPVLRLVNGAAASTDATQTLNVPQGTVVPLSANPASNVFVWGTGWDRWRQRLAATTGQKPPPRWTRTKSSRPVARSHRARAHPIRTYAVGPFDFTRATRVSL